MTHNMYVITVRVAVSDNGASKLRADIGKALNQWGSSDENQNNAAEAQFSRVVATKELNKSVQGIIDSMNAIKDHNERNGLLQQFWLSLQLVNEKAKEGLVLPLVDANRDLIQEKLGIKLKPRRTFWPFRN